MIKNWFKQIQQQKIFAKAAFLLVFFALSTSCTDQGCIDADDFGEYESQTIEVESNMNQDSCTYDASAPDGVTDTVQGSGIKSCLTTGTVSITDENNSSQSSTPAGSGCVGFTDVKFQNLCISNCVQSCMASQGSGTATPEPNWNSTSARATNSNDGVTISPGSQVIITAIGQIKLGESLIYPSAYVQADNPYPHYKNTNWGDTFFDARAGQTIDVKFSGNWTDVGDGGNGGRNNVVVGNGASTTFTAASYNGARRAVIYLIPHPTGYNFDTSQTSEKTGTKSVPLMPDPEAWTCIYSGASLRQASCSQKTNGYTSIGYTNADDAQAATAFPFSSEYQTSILSSYGGAIRWTEDGTNSSTNATESTAADFNAASCSLSGSTYSCNSAMNSMEPTTGRVIGDISSTNVTIENPSGDGSAYQVTFKSLTGNTACNITLNIEDGTGQALTVDVNNTAWKGSSPDNVITLEAGQKIVVNHMSTTCGGGIGVKFDKFKDIPITQSGFVSFTMLSSGSGAGTSCRLKGRILNPKTLRSPGVTDTRNESDSNYYEYDSFNATPSTDPFSDQTQYVQASNSSQLFWTDGKIFVRKGQVIRLSADSWNNTWTANGLTRQCGIGMVMKINPRPALLCRGMALDYVTNPNCVPKYNSNTGALSGCQSYADECANANDASNYCPSASCRDTIECATDGIAPDFAATGCTRTAPAACSGYTDAIAATADSPYVNPSTATTCSNCSALLLVSAQQPAKITVDYLDLCYDLENYYGKVSSIQPTESNYYSPVVYTQPDDVLAQGLVKLGNFNGSYGNLENFVDAKTVDSKGDEVLQLTSPIIFSSAGRIKYFMLDGSDFGKGSTGPISAYNNPTNSAHSSAYSGDNGLSIIFSGMLDFSNGQWLQARLCKESSSTSTDCKGSDPAADDGDATYVANQPRVIDITAPTSSTPPGTPPVITSSYQFNSYGYILRTTGPVGTVVNGTTSYIDCTTVNNGIQSDSGVNFYCHTYNYYSDAALKSMSDSSRETVNNNIKKLRLTFKILDPEATNCTYGSANKPGVKISNPYYESTPSSNIGATCEGTSATQVIASDGSASCTKQFYCANVYANNSGSYLVNVKVKTPIGSNISSIIGSVIMPVIEVMDGPKSLNCKVSGAASSNDGVLTPNPDYIDTNPSNVGATCPDATSPCTYQYYCKAADVGQAERIYKLLIADSRFKSITTMCFVMMFTFYGVGYLMGTSELNHSEIMNRIIKIGLIYLFIGEQGWYWFDTIIVKFFKNGTDYLAFMMASSFDDSPTIATAIATGDYYDKSVLFSSVDEVFSMFFSQAVQKKISALLFASIFGWAYLLIIYNSFMLYIYAVSNAVLLYLTAQVFISILFTLGPIFFIFTLFTQTKDMFDNWLKQLIGFSLQQIFLLTTLAFFNMLMYEVIKMSLGYKICWDEVWTINIITRITLLSFWNIASLPPRTNAQSDVGNIGNPEGIPSLFSILFIWVIASLMNKFIAFMTDLASSIGGGISASSLGKGIADSVNEARKLAKQARSAAWEKTGGQVMQRADMALFDSGKMADEARNKRKAQNTKDKSNKSALKGASDKAVSDYKIKNAGALAAMGSDEERSAAIKSVSDKAMAAKGKELGLKKKDIERLKNDKGFKTETDNIFVAALQLGGQGLSQARGKGGSLSQSLNDQAPDSKLSFSEAKKALKAEKDPTKREDLLKAFESKDLVKEKTRMEKADTAIRSVGSMAAIKTKEAAEKTMASASEGLKATGKTLGDLGRVAQEGRLSEVAKRGATSAKDSAIKGVGSAINSLQEGVASTMKSAKNNYRDVKDAVSDKAEAAGEAIKQTKEDFAKVAKEKRLAEVATRGLKTAAKDTFSATKTGVKSVVASTASAAKSAAIATSKAVKGAVIDEDYDKAAKQLEEKGIINKMKAGTGWARDASEKKLINERKQQNKKASKADTSAAPRIAEISELKRENAYISDVQKSEEGTGTAVDKAVAKASAAIERYNPQSKAAAQMKTETQQNVKANLKTALQSELKSANAELKGSVDDNGVAKPGLEAARETAAAQLSQANKAYTDHLKNSGAAAKDEQLAKIAKATPMNALKAMLPTMAGAAARQVKVEAKEAQGKLDALDPTAAAARKTHGFISRNFSDAFGTGKNRKEDMAARQAQKELSRSAVDPKLAELSDNRKKAAVALSTIDDRIGNVKGKIGGLEKFEKAANKADEVVRAEGVGSAIGSAATGGSASTSGGAASTTNPAEVTTTRSNVGAPPGDASNAANSMQQGNLPAPPASGGGNSANSMQQGNLPAPPQSGGGNAANTAQGANPMGVSSANASSAAAGKIPPFAVGFAPGGAGKPAAGGAKGGPAPKLTPATAKKDALMRTAAQGKTNAAAKKGEAKNKKAAAKDKKDKSKGKSRLDKLLGRADGGKENDMKQAREDEKGADKELNQARRYERKSERDFEGYSKISKETLDKADNLVNNAEEILNREGVDKGSLEYKNAARVKSEFEKVESPQDFKDFVGNEEKRAKKVQKKYDSARTVEDFENL